MIYFQIVCFKFPRKIIVNFANKKFVIMIKFDIIYLNKFT